MTGPDRAAARRSSTSSRIYTFNALITGQWDAFVDALRHLILPADRAGHDPARDHRPDHPLQPARRARPRLRPDRPGQGPGERLGRRPPRHCANAMLPVVTIIGLQLGGLLAGAVLTETIVQPGRRRADRLRGDHRPRLRRDPGLHPGHRGRLRDRQPARRHLVRLPRPADPAAMSATSDRADALPADRRSGADAGPRPPRRRLEPVARHARATSFASAPRVVGLVILGAPVFVRDLRRPSRAYDPNDVAARPSSRAPCSVAAVHPPARLPGRPAAAPARPRRQRPRRVQPGRLRRPDLARRSASSTVGFAILIGSLIGRVAGYAGGWVDNILMRIMDVLLVFPSLLLAIAIVTAARAGPDQRPARDRHRGDPGLCPDHARVGPVGPRAATS